MITLVLEPTTILAIKETILASSPIVNSECGAIFFKYFTSWKKLNIVLDLLKFMTFVFFGINGMYLPCGPDQSNEDISKIITVLYSYCKK